MILRLVSRFPIAGTASDQIAFAFQSLVLNVVALKYFNGKDSFLAVTLMLFIQFLSPVLNAVITWRLIDKKEESMQVHVAEAAAIIFICIFLAIFVGVWFNISLAFFLIILITFLINAYYLFLRDILISERNYLAQATLAIATTIFFSFLCVFFLVSEVNLVIFLLLFCSLPKLIWIVLCLLSGYYRRGSVNYSSDKISVTKDWVLRAAAVFCVYVRTSGLFFLLAALGGSGAAIALRKFAVIVSPANQLLQISYQYVIPSNQSVSSKNRILLGISAAGVIVSMILAIAFFDKSYLTLLSIVLVVPLMCVRAYFFIKMRKNHRYEFEIFCTLSILVVLSLLKLFFDPSIAYVAIYLFTAECVYVATSFMLNIDKSET